MFKTKRKDTKEMKALLIGIGAAGNKAVLNAVEEGSIDINDTVIVNSTSKDFPSNYNGRKIVTSDSDVGCGKERAIAKEYMRKAIGDGKFNFDNITSYEAVIIVSSLEGGNGGATPLIAKFFNQVCTRNVHVIAFTGFEEDVRGLSNTVEFFKEIDPNIMVQTISNASFMNMAGGNKLQAEKLANKEMATRIAVLTGKDFISGSQNIDDTDILKLANTTGYMTVEKKIFNKSLETVDDFDKVVKNMIYNSASIKSDNPQAARIGVILNISPSSEDAIDYTFKQLKEYYGNPFEFFHQIQWDGEKEYIAYIASGMKMPVDEIEAVYNRFVKEMETVNSKTDEFFSKMSSLDTSSSASRFDMITNNTKGSSLADFLSNN